ncbi:hypothetical protein BDF14DRAFT_646640 [Spinellus fusiger]|nr:hypothetical protein BDF14DRAFT_646640 [Spinellus fusiger]
MTEYHNTKLTEEQQERFDQWLKTEDAILQAHFLSNHQSARYTRLKVANVSKEILKKDTKRNLFTRTTEKLPQAKANPLKRAAAMTMKRPATVLDTRLKNKKIKTASSSQKPGSTKPHVSKALQTGHPRSSTTTGEKSSSSMTPTPPQEY